MTIEQRKLINETFNMAIKALEQEPCEDAISREAAIEFIDSWKTDEIICDMDVWQNEIADDIKFGISELPSVTPSRQKGNWIKKYSGYECSECACDSRRKSDFCQYCGAEMVEPQERSDME